MYLVPPKTMFQIHFDQLTSLRQTLLFSPEVRICPGSPEVVGTKNSRKSDILKACKDLSIDIFFKSMSMKKDGKM